MSTELSVEARAGMSLSDLSAFLRQCVETGFPMNAEVIVRVNMRGKITRITART